MSKLKGSHSSTSSAAEAGGRKHSSSPSGRTTSLFGPPASPVNPSPSPEKVRPKRTRGTSGPGSLGLFVADDPSTSWVSRLLHRMALRGSIEYSMTLSALATPAGRVICRLRASERPNDGSGCFGWPAPTTEQGGPESLAQKRDRGAWGTSTAGAALSIRPWPAPAANEFECSAEQLAERRKRMDEKHQNGNGGGATTGAMVSTIRPWQAPTAADAEGGHERRGGGRSSELLLPGQVKAIRGTPPSLLSATNPEPTEPSSDAFAGLRLHPGHSLWLQGMPVWFLWNLPMVAPPSGRTGGRPSGLSGT